MRTTALCLLLAAVSACSDRRSFDERYGDTANNIEQRAARIDTDVNSSEEGELRPPD